MNTGVLADTLCHGNLDPLLPNQPLTICCQVYTYTLNASGTPVPYLRYNVPAYVLLEIMEEEHGSIPLELPDPRPTPVLSPVEGCELPCPPGCECSSGLRRVGKDGYEDDDEPSEALILYPDNWTQTSEYVREYQEIDKRTFHKPGDRDCVAIDRNQWMDYDYFYIQLVQDPYVTPSDVSSQARIVLPATYSAGCSGFGSCDMHG